MDMTKTWNGLQNGVANGLAHSGFTQVFRKCPGAFPQVSIKPCS